MKWVNGVNKYLKESGVSIKQRLKQCRDRGMWCGFCRVLSIYSRRGLKVDRNIGNREIFIWELICGAIFFEICTSDIDIYHVKLCIWSGWFLTSPI